MGYFGKLEEKRIAIKLRKDGLSYSEIQKSVKVSKSTLSSWCKEITLTKKQIQNLANKKIYGQSKGSHIAAQNKINKKIELTEEIFKLSAKDIGKLTKRDRFILGIALYAGEGYKNDHSIGFANSNPIYIKFMYNWLSEFCEIPKYKFRGAIWIHDNLNSKEAEDYWSKLLDMPKKQLHKTYISKNKTDSSKIRKNLHQYGIFSIRVSDSSKQRQILGWISASFGAKISPVI